MKGDFDWGNLVHWARLDLGLPLDADYSIPDEYAREMLAQIAETGTMDRPLMELVAAYGTQMRRIFAARIKDAGEMEAAENEFWEKVVQSAGKYGGESPVVHWLSVIAKRQAISAYRRLSRRNRFVASLAEMASKMRDAREVDDLDLESLTDKDAAVEERPATPDKVLEQEELAKAAHRLARYLEQSEDRATRLIFRRYIEGASYKQMAREEHTTCSNMRTRVSRAIASSRQTLIDVYQGGDLEYAKKKEKKSLA